MSQPEIVQTGLNGEDVVARVDLGGEDELYVTPTRTLLYRAEGLLSDESVEEHSHEAERITVSEGRRKAKVTLDYGLDGEETISLPAKRLDRALPPIVEGVLRANGILDDDEDLERLFRFSELTIVIAEKRIVRHIGGNLWDEDFESYRYDDVTDLDFEDGSVATSVVLTVNGRQERFKAPNEDARAVRAALETTLLSYWGVDSLEELRAAAEPDDEDGNEGEREADENVSFGDGPDPLIADPAEPEELPENATRGSDSEAGAEEVTQQVERSSATESAPGTRSRENESIQASGDASGSEAEENGGDTETTWADSIRGSTTGGPSESSGRADETDSGSGFEGSGFESAAPDADEQVREELAELREVIERQNQELRTQRELIEQLIEELRRGR